MYLHRIFQTLGCPHGCGDGVRGSLGDHLRAQGMSCLTRLHRIHPTLFRQFLRQILIKRPLQEIVDFLHALLGFCVDPSGRCQSPIGEVKLAYTMYNLFILVIKQSNFFKIENAPHKPWVLALVSRWCSGVGVTKPISSVPLFSENFNIVKTHIMYWISRLYLAGVAAAQLRWHLPNINVIQRI